MVKQSFSQAVGGDDPVIYWRLGETTGSTAASDPLWTNGLHNATIIGSPTLGVDGIVGADPAGSPNKAMAFNGSTARLEDDGDVALGLISPWWTPTTALTVEFWYKGTQEGSYNDPQSQRLISATSDDPTGKSWCITIDIYGRVRAWGSPGPYAGGFASLGYSYNAINDGQWHHIAFYVYSAYGGDSNYGSLLVDGSSYYGGSTGASWTGPETTPTKLHVMYNDLTDLYTEGTIDEIAIYFDTPTTPFTAPLDSYRLTSHYNIGIIPPPSSTVPDEPTGVTAVAGVERATVSWVKPDHVGGSEVTGYVVTPFVGATAGTPQSFASTATTQIVTGLTGGVSYTFKVQSTNSFGSGPSSTASNAVVIIETTVPSAVTAVAGPEQATVSWAAPVSDGGSPITGYVVTPYEGDPDTVEPMALTPRTFTSIATTQVIAGLMNGVSYTFKVQAVNSLGLSGYSPTSNLVTISTSATLLPASGGVSPSGGALDGAGVRVTPENTVNHVRLPAVEAVPARPLRWQGRPWAPDEIPGIDPEYTWGFPNPYNHDFRIGEGHGRYNTVPLDRSNRSGWSDGNFIIPQDYDPYWGYDDAPHAGHLITPLDNQWAISTWIQDSYTEPGIYGYLHAALMERVNGDVLELRHQITVAPSFSASVISFTPDLAKPMVEVLSPNRVIVACHQSSGSDSYYSYTGTPWIYVIERVGSQIHVAIEHRVDAAYDDETLIDGYPATYGTPASVWGLAVLNPNKFVLSWPGAYIVSGAYGPDVIHSPRIAVCEISGSSITEQVQFFSPKIGLDLVGDYYDYPSQYVSDNFAGVGFCKLNETTLAYSVLLETIPEDIADGDYQSVRIRTWHVGRMRINDLDFTADYPATIDNFYKRSPHPATGAVSWEESGALDLLLPPDMYRVSETEVVCAYQRHGRVTPFHVAHDDGSIETYPPQCDGYPFTAWSTTWEYGLNPSGYGSFIPYRLGSGSASYAYPPTAPCVRRLRFESDPGVDTVLHRFPQHFLDIAMPGWFCPDNYSYDRYGAIEENFGITACNIHPIGEGKFVATWLRGYIFMHDIAGYSGYNPLDPIEIWSTSPADVASPVHRHLLHENIKAIYGFPPVQDMDSTRLNRYPVMWTILDLDESSPSGLHSNGASNAHFPRPNSYSLMSLPRAFSDGVLCISGGTDSPMQGYLAPVWPGYYQYTPEILAESLNFPDGDQASVMIPNSTGKTRFADPDQYIFDGGHDFDQLDRYGPTYEESYLQDFYYYSYEPEAYVNAGVYPPPPGGVLDVDELYDMDPYPEDLIDQWYEWENAIPYPERTLNMFVIKMGQRGTPVPGDNVVRVKKEGEQR